ncbi:MULTISPECIES: helix-turn-helix domain-containing protein [Staphylococcus]|uniref:helix-turn-helix domain-containing protein n=1 Tax=Staphylococcus TaxID=1279 RepID=UPI001AEC2916|nr:MULTISPECIES: helix-turn-helix transcriptional regulator [Staphylococcus]MDU0462081.1 helix-turn-helix transcriptional regulator [Staphylococcus ureilyticus]
MKNDFRILIAERKLNIAEVNRDTGIAKTTLYGLYKETTKNPDTKTVMKLCEYLEVTPNEFFGIKESVVN